MEERIGELIDLVGLSKALNKRVSAYSWGMKQRLSLAAALLSDPQLLLMDEPTNGLDPAGIADVRRLLPKLAYEQKRTVLLSSHRMEEVEQICDHVTIIHEGRIVGAGSPEELTSSQRWIEIECDDVDAAIRVLEPQTGPPVERLSMKRFKMSAPSMTAGDVEQRLESEGIYARHVVERGESLEEVFFRLTGARRDD